MKIELGITEIAAQLGCSERTALRRIADGKLTAKHIGPNRYLVNIEAIEDLAPRAKLAGLAKQVTALANEIEALRQENAILKNRVENLEQRFATMQTMTPTSVKVPATRKKQSDDLPAGSITLAQLATELGINRTTLLGHVKNESNHLVHIAIEKPNRPGEYIRYFTPEQAASVKSWHSANTKKQSSLWQ